MKKITKLFVYINFMPSSQPQNKLMLSHILFLHYTTHIHRHNKRENREKKLSIFSHKKGTKRKAFSCSERRKENYRNFLVSTKRPISVKTWSFFDFSHIFSVIYKAKKKKSNLTHSFTFKRKL